LDSERRLSKNYPFGRSGIKLVAGSGSNPRIQLFLPAKQGEKIIGGGCAESKDPSGFSEKAQITCLPLVIKKYAQTTPSADGFS
jgi:hypothetical protein